MSIGRNAKVIDPPSGALPKVPDGFIVQVLATGFKQPRTLRIAPNGDIFLSESGSLHPLRVGVPGAMLETRGWVYGAEDLHYSPLSDDLWSLAEHPGSRYVFAVARERIVAGCD